ncbi:MAG: RraA family protein [Chloroflexi bacterium]|nr:RraA family protein [Chloroflexota bacterium]MBV9602711.1 RraA family protein [Chloroflexota bacterium]
MSADATVDGLRELPTATISDALDRLAIVGQCLGIAPLDPRFRLCGRAFTLRYRPTGAVERGNVGDYIDDVPPGDIVVLDNAGRLDCTVWGDILTAVSHRRGVGGTVIDGVCRDVTRALDLGYPIFSRGRYMRTGKDRVEVESQGAPISLGEVQVRQGDILVGDADGILVIPAVRESEVLEVAREIEEAEQAIERETAKGTRLDEARRVFRYHQLQTH